MPQKQSEYKAIIKYFHQSSIYKIEGIHPLKKIN